MNDAEAREKRRAEALRANLRRRKAKASEAGVGDTPAGASDVSGDPSLPPLLSDP